MEERDEKMCSAWVINGARAVQKEDEAARWAMRNFWKRCAMNLTVRMRVNYWIGSAARLIQKRSIGAWPMPPCYAWPGMAEARNSTAVKAALISRLRKATFTCIRKKIFNACFWSCDVYLRFLHLPLKISRQENSTHCVSTTL